MKRLVLFAASALLLFSCEKENTDSQIITAIDLGLSVKWANANLGAKAPEQYGDYFAWGETENKRIFDSDWDWDTYKWCNGDSETLTKYNNNSSYGAVDDKTELDAEDDVAHVRLGGNWRMPTVNEVEELISTQNNANYKWEWKSLNGYDGCLVTYLVNNNSIFLPAAGCRSVTSQGNAGSFGYYWSSSLCVDAPWAAEYLYFASSSFVESLGSPRFQGFSVRPVTE